MMQQLAPAADALQQALLIVLDVRGKSGGASHWSIELARLIWGLQRWMHCVTRVGRSGGPRRPTLCSCAASCSR